jgi:hypothetical protein
MGRACSKYGMEDGRLQGFCWVRQNERDHQEDLDVGKSKVVPCGYLNKYCEMYGGVGI